MDRSQIKYASRRVNNKDILTKIKQSVTLAEFITATDVLFNTFIKFSIDYTDSAIKEHSDSTLKEIKLQQSRNMYADLEYLGKLILVLKQRLDRA